MESRAKVGLLPLYLELYDKVLPETRLEFTPFLNTIRQAFEGGGIEVVMADVCRLEPEFEAAVAAFEANGVDLIVAVHLAYSPSLESVEPLGRTHLPLLLLDTTMDHDFGQGVDRSRIMFNHGIHGVQDLASMLRRRGRHYEIVAGHVTESDVMVRAIETAYAARAANRFRGARALRIGESFKGMGDFAVSEPLLRDTFGIEVDTIGLDALEGEIARVNADAVAEEMLLDRERFSVEADPAVHERTVRVSLGLRRPLEAGGYTAFSMNFAAFDRSEGPVSTVPFLEASKAMARGLGYAGEGDVLTACLVGALNAGFGSTTFTEIFCPDWKGNALFLSHMGEMNPQVAAGQPRLIEMDFPYAEAQNPAILACAFAPGEATLVNLAPGPGDSFGLLAGNVEVLEDTHNPTMRDSIRAWVRPRSGDLGAFLEAYSRCGGTHHSALTYGATPEAVRAFAAFVGIPMVNI